MGDLVIKGPQKPTFTPDVHLNEQEGKGFIKGESYQEDPSIFYMRLTEWFDAYFSKHNSFILDVELTYINSSCSRAMVDLLKTFHKFREAGKTVQVNWYYDPDDDDMEMLEDGEDFMVASNFELNLVPMEEDD